MDNKINDIKDEMSKIYKTGEESVKAELLIKNGHVYDPAAGIDFVGNVAVNDGIISGLDTGETVTGEKEIDATGYMVVPGLIDIHTHCNWLGNYIGMPADLAGVPAGVTATIDAGSSGVSNYRALFRYLDTCVTKTKIMLHVSAGGQIMTKQFSENTDPKVWNRKLFQRAFERYGNRIVGFKIRMSKSVVGEMGMYPLEEAVKLAESFSTRLFVHSTNPPGTMDELVSYLRKGDVLCHMYHGEGENILGKNGITPGIQKARERGVIFDVSQGQGNFSIPIAMEAIKEGFLPDAISTDLNIENWNHPYIFSLLLTMSKLMAMGMSFEEVIRRVTSTAAEIYGEAGKMGTLAEGTCADITILECQQKEVLFRDKYHNELIGNSLLMPMATIIDGQLFYCSGEMMTIR